MKIRESKEISSLEKAPATDKPIPSPRPEGDKVSIEAARKVQDAIVSGRAHGAGGRTARLEQIETAVRGGNYRPDPSRLAEQILNAAEVDAKLRAMLNG
jgi:anti-sigma28 factor (negative regulator of flagellin synthesis)